MMTLDYPQIQLCVTDICGQPACGADIVVRCELCTFGQCHGESDYGINYVVMFIKKLKPWKSQGRKRTCGGLRSQEVPFYKIKKFNLF